MWLDLYYTMNSIFMSMFYESRSKVVKEDKVMWVKMHTGFQEGKKKELE